MRNGRHVASIAIFRSSMTASFVTAADGQGSTLIPRLGPRMKRVGPTPGTPGGLDDQFHETTQLFLRLSIHGMRPFRASHMIRTLKTLD